MRLNEATILLVDDEPMLRELWGTWLGHHVRNVFLAEDGEEALRILSVHEIDLILSDIRMPRMSGVELIKKINETNGQRPAVILIPASVMLPCVRLRIWVHRPFWKSQLRMKTSCMK